MRYERPQVTVVEICVEMACNRPRFRYATRRSRNETG